MDEKGASPDLLGRLVGNKQIHHVGFILGLYRYWRSQLLGWFVFCFLGVRHIMRSSTHPCHLPEP